MAIPPELEVFLRLHQIEQDHGVCIIFACEAGSRAWGFESPDSDYDVRFVYVRPQDWYLSINVENRRDVIECPIVDDYDINGWDLRKALKLLRKSNPSLLEWIYSPIQYRNIGGILESLRELAEGCFNDISVSYHYNGMAYRNYREYLKGDEVWVKKYLYVIRPILSIEWVRQYETHPPVDFTELRNGLVIPDDVDAAIDRVLAFKLVNQEKAYGISIPVLNRYIEDRLGNKEYRRGRSTAVVPIDDLDQLFKQTVTNGDGECEHCHVTKKTPVDGREET